MPQSTTRTPPFGMASRALRQRFRRACWSWPSSPSTTTDSEEGLNLMWMESVRSEEHTSELQSLTNLVCRLLLEKKKNCNGNCHFGTKHDVQLPDTHFRIYRH